MTKLRMRVGIVIPVHNEQAILAANIGRLMDFFSANDLGCEPILFIAENGSSDATVQRIEELVVRFPTLRFSTSPIGGRGRALKHAWEHLSDVDIVGYMDADLSTELAALPIALRSLMQDGFDIAIGSRLMKTSCVKRSVIREIISQTYNFLLHRMLDLTIADAQCGFKFLWRKHALQLLPLIKNNHWFFDTELLALGEHAGLRIAEIPVAWAENRKSTVRLLPTIREEFAGVLRLRRTLQRLR